MFRIMLAFVLIAACVAPAARAQDAGGKAGVPPLLMLSQLVPTHPERVLLAFYKLTGLEPDYKTWAGRSPFLRDAKPVDRNAIIDREENRLRRAFAEFDEKDPIVVHTRVQLDEYSTLQNKLHLSEFTPKTFFSYGLYGENIAIVPKDITAFGSLPITHAQMEDILKKAGGGQVVAELILKPAIADGREPFVQNGTSYWLLLAEIGEIRLWSLGDNPALLWMQRAGWYKPRVDSGLLNLKGTK